MRFSHNLTHGIWGKVNDCTLLYSTVQYRTVQYSAGIYAPPIVDLIHQNVFLGSLSVLSLLGILLHFPVA